jgi:predicted amidophosphoribosyltransferase
VGDRFEPRSRGILRKLDALTRFSARCPGQRDPFRFAGVIRLGLGSVLDFLVEDGCVLCRRPHDRRRKRGSAFAEPVRCLLEPVKVSCLFGVLKAENHPVCGGCAEGLVVARSIGVLGRLIGPGIIETTFGERFGGTADPALDVHPAEHEDKMSDREWCGDGPPMRSSDERTIHVVSPFMTTDSTLKIIHLLKFSGYVDLARPIARSMGWAIRRFGTESESTAALDGTTISEATTVSEGAAVLVPTPMDRGSERRRGFNQAERIARELAIDLGFPVATGVLRKTARTQRQSTTGREHRARNVRYAFSCSAPSTSGLSGKSVLLVDDLVTTGATAASCGAALLRAGVRSVTVLCFGRAM